MSSKKRKIATCLAMLLAAVAAIAIYTSRDQIVNRYYLYQLETGKVEYLANAASTLANRKYRPAIPVLARLLSNEPPPAWIVVDSLCRFGDEGNAKLGEYFDQLQASEQDEFISSIVNHEKTGEVFVPLLVHAALSRSRLMEIAAARLASFPSQLVRECGLQLKASTAVRLPVHAKSVFSFTQESESLSARQALAFALLARTRVDASTLLPQLLQVSEVSNASAKLIGSVLQNMDAAEVPSVLAPLLDQGSARSRLRVAYALGRKKLSKAWMDLIAKALDDRDATVRLVVLDSLVEGKSPDLDFSVLLNKLTDPQFGSEETELPRRQASRMGFETDPMNNPRTALPSYLLGMRIHRSPFRDAFLDVMLGLLSDPDSCMVSQCLHVLKVQVDASRSDEFSPALSRLIPAGWDEENAVLHDCSTFIPFLASDVLERLRTPRD